MICTVSMSQPNAHAKRNAVTYTAKITVKLGGTVIYTTFCPMPTNPDDRQRFDSGVFRAPFNDQPLDGLTYYTAHKTLKFANHYHPEVARFLIVFWNDNSTDWAVYEACGQQITRDNFIAGAAGVLRLDSRVEVSADKASVSEINELIKANVAKAVDEELAVAERCTEQAERWARHDIPHERRADLALKAVVRAGEFAQIRCDNQRLERIGAIAARAEAAKTLALKRRAA